MKQERLLLIVISTSFFMAGIISYPCAHTALWVDLLVSTALAVSINPDINCEFMELFGLSPAGF